MNTNNKNGIFIIGFTVILVICIGGFFFFKSAGTDDQTPTANITGGTPNTVANAPAQTMGDISATVKADIVLREVDFSMSKDDVQAKEEKMDDTVNTPSIASGTDGYSYITYASSADKPLTLYDIQVAQAENTGVCYVFVNDSLTEVRFQFGMISNDLSQALINKFTSSYGEKTFYRAQNGTENCWWKTDKVWLMVTKDSVGTTVFYRKAE